MLVFLVTPCLVVTAQPCMEWIPMKKKSEFYYCNKFSVYNLSCVDLSTKQGYCCVWDESIARRGANEIVSCLYKLIEFHCSCDSMELSIFADNCRDRTNTFFCWNVVTGSLAVSGYSVYGIVFSQSWSHTEWRWFNIFCKWAKYKGGFNLSFLSMDNINGGT